MEANCSVPAVSNISKTHGELSTWGEFFEINKNFLFIFDSNSLQSLFGKNPRSLGHIFRWNILRRTVQLRPISLWLKKFIFRHIKTLICLSFSVTTHPHHPIQVQQLWIRASCLTGETFSLSNYVSRRAIMFTNWISFPLSVLPYLFSSTSNSFHSVQLDFEARKNPLIE